MKIIQHNNGVVVDIINARQDATAENIAIVDRIPACEHRDGYTGVLMYGENGLYWAYKEAKASEHISDLEALAILMGGDVR